MVEERTKHDKIQEQIRFHKFHEAAPGGWQWWLGGSVTENPRQN